jgi:hypothetical protein
MPVFPSPWPFPVELLHRGRFQRVTCPPRTSVFTAAVLRRGLFGRFYR